MGKGDRVAGGKGIKESQKEEMSKGGILIRRSRLCAWLSLG